MKPGTPANPSIGLAAVRGLYVKFQNGEVTINEDVARRLGTTQDDLIQMMKRHGGYGKDGDFVAVDDTEIEDMDRARFARTDRGSTEPEHDIYEVDYGHIGKNVNPKPKLQLTADQQKTMREIATKLAMELAPKLATEMLQKMVTQKQEEKADEVIPIEIKDETQETGESLEAKPRKRGRPKSLKTNSDS